MLTTVQLRFIMKWLSRDEGTYLSSAATEEAVARDRMCAGRIKSVVRHRRDRVTR